MLNRAGDGNSSYWWKLQLQNDNLTRDGNCSQRRDLQLEGILASDANYSKKWKSQLETGIATMGGGGTLDGNS